MFKAGDQVILNKDYTKKLKAGKISTVLTEEFNGKVSIDNLEGFGVHVDVKDLTHIGGSNPAINFLGAQAGSNSVKPLFKVGDFVEPLCDIGTLFKKNVVYRILATYLTNGNIELELGAYLPGYAVRVESRLFKHASNSAQSQMTQSNSTQQSTLPSILQPGDDLECIVGVQNYLTKGKIYSFKNWGLRINFVTIAQDDMGIPTSWETHFFVPYQPSVPQTFTGTGPQTITMPNGINFNGLTIKIKEDTGPNCHCGNKDNPIGQGHSYWCDRYKHEFV